MKKICLLVLSAFLMAAFAGPHYAKQKEEDYSIAYINDYDGDCELKRKGQSTGEAILDIFIPLYRGDTVITGAGSKLEIVFDDATIMRLDPNSRLVIKELKREKSAATVLELIKGRVMGVVKKLTKQEEFTVRTKMAMAAVKGTELLVETGDEDKVAVFEGAVEVSNLDMDGKVRSRVILDKDREITVVKRLKGPARPEKLSRNFVKKYNEITDLRKKIELVREHRRSKSSREYRLERRLQRIENLKMMRSDRAMMKNMTPEQRRLMDEMIRQEEFYRAQYDDLKKKDRRTKTRIKQYLEENKEKE